MCGVLTEALSTCARRPVSLTVAGRTDAGVHAAGQVAHVDLPAGVALGGLVRRLARLLPPDVRVRALTAVPAEFDARFSALRRHYRYRIATAPHGAEPLRARDTVSWPHPADPDAMNTAAAGLLGEHDFAAYCRRREGATTIRELQRCRWTPAADGVLVAEVSADAFCHSMVRGLVGALLAVGRGQRPVGWPAELLTRADRASEVTVAPAHGLSLVGVDYPDPADLAARAAVTRRMRARIPLEATVPDHGSSEQKVARHYSHGGLLAALLAGLAGSGRPTGPIDPDDLAPGDEFHIGGRLATVAFFDQVQWRSGMHVLDVGSGVGGPARYLAHHRGARVTGVDLTPEFVEVATELTERCGLADAVSFRVGSGTELPFDEGSFDAACLLHVGMNIEDKARLFAEVRRVVRPGGWFGVYDVMRTGPGELEYPVPWAAAVDTSFVADQQTYRQLLTGAGFRIEHVRDRREFGIEFFSRLRAAAADGPPPLGPHIVIGPDFGTKVGNLIEAMRRGVVAPTEMIGIAEQ